MTLAKFNYKYIIILFSFGGGGGDFAKFTAPHYIAIPPRAMMFVCEWVGGGGVMGKGVCVWGGGGRVEY